MRAVAFALALLIAASASAQAPNATGANPANTAPSIVATVVDPSHPDRSCKVDADCQVKNVGNCCGAFPECVNKDAPVDPKAVREQCASEHRMGMCHVMAVHGCSCVQGQCSAQIPRKP